MQHLTRHRRLLVRNITALGNQIHAARPPGALATTILDMGIELAAQWTAETGEARELSPLGALACHFGAR